MIVCSNWRDACNKVYPDSRGIIPWSKPEYQYRASFCELAISENRPSSEAFAAMFVDIMPLLSELGGQPVLEPSFPLTYMYFKDDDWMPILKLSHPHMLESMFVIEQRMRHPLDLITK